tara:strand:+ start:421 stop:792 length:372 start_codon:yes stop_codon:yes gene_type:complete
MIPEIVKKTIKKINESDYKLERKLSDTLVSLKIERDTHVPDLLTRIRIAPGIAVVGQKAKVKRFFDGDAQVFVGIKYMTKTDEVYASVKQLADTIKVLPGVKSVAILMHNGKKITMDGKKLLF